MYLSLYRKYRPKFFSDVVGQDVIVKTLKNSIINKNFGHAYLFYGPRGVGKTTISKIFSRSINCLNNVNGECCEKCENCLSSFENDCVDIIEIDAASNNGVDEIRELKNKIMLVPNKLKYKVYIIDEVHMLSIGAFNALLKTLEEPPEHVIFILATTDPQKVPDTIVSRCQCFLFKPISAESIVKRLEFVCKEEKISVDKKVLTLISKYSDGGMRDSLSMLDKLVSYTNSKITEKDFYELNDMISEEEILEYVETILNFDIEQFLTKNNEFASCGKNFINIILQSMYYLHDAIIKYYLSKTEKLKFDFDLTEKFIKFLNENIINIKKSENPRLYFEIVVLNFINLNKNISREIISDDNNDKLRQNNLKNINEISSNLLKNNKPSDTRKIININEIMLVRLNNILADATKEELNIERDNFLKFKDYVFDQKIGYLACALIDADIRAASDSGVILSYKYDSTVEQNLNIIDKLIEIYNKILKNNKKIVIISENVWNLEKEKYIKCIKEGNKYTIMDEPEAIFEDFEKSDILNEKTIDLFGDIVEIDN